jgi:hypothetical protein
MMHTPPRKNSRTPDIHEEENYERIIPQASWAELEKLEPMNIESSTGNNYDKKSRDSNPILTTVDDFMKGRSMFSMEQFRLAIVGLLVILFFYYLGTSRSSTSVATSNKPKISGKHSIQSWTSWIPWSERDLRVVDAFQDLPAINIRIRRSCRKSKLANLISSVILPTESIVDQAMEVSRKLNNYYICKFLPLLFFL